MLALLAGRPTAPVLLTIGADNAEAITTLLPSYLVLTLTDLGDAALLEGRAVLCWPPAEDDAWEAFDTWIPVIKAAGPARFRVLNTTQQVYGWQASDALADHWTTEKTETWARTVVGPDLMKLWAVPFQASTAVTVEPYDPSAPDPPAPPPRQPPKPRVLRQTETGATLALSEGGPEPVPPVAAQPSAGFTAIWRALELRYDARGIPHTNLENIVRVLDSHERTASHLWFDSFYQTAFTDLQGPVTEISDDTILALTVWLQRDIGLVRLEDGLVHKAVQTMASLHTRSAPKDWLMRLSWDNTPRLYDFLPRYLGAKKNPYHREAGRNFFRSMVARILTPGCQVDTMLVLEGQQGTGKTSALKILGGHWYAVANESVMNKDFYLMLRGKMLVEIGEMHSFSKAELSRVKAAISTPTDYYRPPYARRHADYPRQTVFAGSTNEHMYLSDATGARRFWPVKCGVIDLLKLAKDRDQLFAEAYFEVMHGEKWYEMPDIDTEAEQESRRNVDVWEELVRRYVVERRERTDGGPWIWVPRNEPLGEVTVQEILTEVLSIEPGRMTRQDQMRVSQCLQGMKWERDQHKGPDGKWRYAYRPALNKPPLTE